MNRDLHRIRFGVNYVPSRNWFYSWNDFEPDAFARDFDAIAALGADHLRVFLIWPWFQPNRRWVSEAHLDRLDRFMELAAARGLAVCPSLITGWASGWAFRPTFDRKPDEFFTNPDLHEPIDLYFRACAQRLNRHDNFLGFDLGNEINCCWYTKKLEDGDAWTNRLLDLCDAISPQAVNTNGVDHNPWFAPFTFSPGNLARRQKIIPLHCWIEFTQALQRGKALDPVSIKLAPAMAALARAHAGDAARPIWLQEFGIAPQWIDDPNKIPDFLEATVRASLAGGMSWITWWCSHDIDRKYQFNEIEYHLGLLTTGNKRKPAAEAFTRLAREYAGKTITVPKLDLPKPPPLEFDATWAWLEKIQPLLPDAP